MRCTLLGTADITGVPPPFRDLDDAGAARRRRRCGLLVETDDAVLLFDAPPEFRDGVRETGVRDLDAVFLTHWHHDHVGGIDDLAMTARDLEFACHLTATASDHFGREKPYLDGRLTNGNSTTASPSALRTQPSRRSRSRTTDPSSTRSRSGSPPPTESSYAPDFGTWCPEKPGGQAYRGADLAILEATSVLSPSPIDDLAPAKTLSPTPTPTAPSSPTSTSTCSIADTAGLERDVETRGYELGRDFETYEV